MSFTIMLENPPEEARYWLPAVYAIDPATGYHDKFEPEDYLSINTPWICPFSAGTGAVVDIQCVTVDYYLERIGKAWLKKVIISDGEIFTFDWDEATKVVYPGEGGLTWLLIPAVALGAIIVAGRRK